MKNITTWFKKSLLWPWLKRWHIVAAVLAVAVGVTVIISLRSSDQSPADYTGKQSDAAQEAGYDFNGDPSRLRVEDGTEIEQSTPMSESETSSAPETVEEVIPDGWAKYTNETSGISFLYPEHWVIRKDADDQFIIRGINGDADNGRQIEFGFGPALALYRDMLERNEPLFSIGTQKFSTNLGTVYELDSDYGREAQSLALLNPEDTTYWDHNAYHSQFTSGGIAGIDGEVYALISHYWGSDMYMFYDNSDYPDLVKIFQSVEIQN